MAAPQWIELDGAANVRDLGGLATTDGGTVQPGRLIRSASLQELTESDVRRLVDEHRVRAVVDLRSGVEVRNEGPGPLTREPQVTHRNLSLFVEEPVPDEADPGEPVILPWQRRDAERTEQDRQRGAAGIYLRYLDERGDSVLAALRLIAHSDGATIVHCAAGKDRTGVIVACALAEVGVTRDAIVADYVASADRIEAILARLAGRRTYASYVDEAEIDVHRPRAETMAQTLDAVDDAYGGFPAWLRANGWTAEDAAALRAKLLAPALDG